MVFSSSGNAYHGSYMMLLYLLESRATLTCLYRTSGRFYMLQLTFVASRHFTQPELSLWWSDLHKIGHISCSAAQE